MADYDAVYLTGRLTMGLMREAIRGGYLDLGPIRDEAKASETIAQVMQARCGSSALQYLLMFDRVVVTTEWLTSLNLQYASAHDASDRSGDATVSDANLTRLSGGVARIVQVVRTEFPEDLRSGEDGSPSGMAAMVLFCGPFVRAAARRNNCTIPIRERDAALVLHLVETNAIILDAAVCMVF